MQCPFCAHLDDKVIDSRLIHEGKVVRRWRECLSCKRRFTTYEQVEVLPLMVIKKNGVRERFNGEKIIFGIVKACEKRPVTLEKIQALVDWVEVSIRQKFEDEVPCKMIGEEVIKELKKLDQVACVRFISVYKDFKDINEFMSELKILLRKDEGGLPLC